LDNPVVVHECLADQINTPAERFCALINSFGQLSQKRLGGGGVEDGMDRVEPQGIDMAIIQPKQRVLDEVFPNAEAISPVKINRLAPGGRVAVGKVRPEGLEEVALRA
jgi:hypothetical protein